MGRANVASMMRRPRNDGIVENDVKTRWFAGTDTVKRVSLVVSEDLAEL